MTILTSTENHHGRTAAPHADVGYAFDPGTDPDRLYWCATLCLSLSIPIHLTTSCRRAARGLQARHATATPIQLQATWTPSPTLELTPSNTPRPTFTPFFTSTPFSLVPPTKTPSQPAHPRHHLARLPLKWKARLFIPTWPATGQASAGRLWMPTTVHVIGTVVVLRGTLNGNTDRTTDRERHQQGIWAFRF